MIPKNWDAEPTGPLCSKCKQGVMDCQCENFHPNITFSDDFKPNVLLIEKTEAEALYTFFMQVGYISYEHDAAIHEFFKKLKGFVE